MIEAGTAQAALVEGGPAGVILLLPALAVAACAFRRPALALAALLFLRAAADCARNVGIVLPGGMFLNPGGALGLAALLVGLRAFAALKPKRYELFLPWIALGTGLLWALCVGVLRFGPGQLSASVRELFRLGAVCGIFAAAYHAAERGREKSVHWGVGAALALCCVWGIGQYLLGGGVLEKTSWVRRATGPFAYPNTLGYVLLGGLNVLAAQFAESQSRKARLRLGAVLALLALGLAFSVSFTLIALSLLSFAGLLYLLRRRLLLAVFAGVLLFSAPLIAPRVRMMLRSNIAEDLADRYPRTTLTARLLIWRHLLYVAGEMPLTGWGLGTVRAVNPVKEFLHARGSDPHNDMILFLVEGGVVGLAAYAAFHLLALRSIAKAADELRETSLAGLSRGLFVTYGAVMAGSLINNLLSFTAFLFLLWAEIGLLLGAAARLSRPSPSCKA